MAGHDDRPRLGSVESACLSAIGGGPRRVLIPQADVERKPAGHLEVVLYKKVPRRVGAAESIRRKASAPVCRQTQRPVGEGVARTRCVGGVFGILAVEGPAPHVDFAIRPEPLMMARLAAE